MIRAAILWCALLLAGAACLPAHGQEGSGQSGKLTGDGLELEWRIDGAETGPRFYADRTWQANGNVTGRTVQFMGVMRVSIPSGFTTDAWAQAYASLPWSEGKQEVKWAGELSGSLLSQEKTFHFTLDVPPGKSVLVNAGVGKNGGVSDMLAVTFSFAAKPVDKTAVAPSPTEPYWAWVRQQPPMVLKTTPGPVGSRALALDGVGFVRTMAPGENGEASTRAMSGYLRWKLPMAIRAGDSAPVEFAIDKVRFNRIDTETRDSATTLELVGIVGKPGGPILTQYETFGRVTKSVTDRSQDVLNPAAVKAVAPLAMPAYAKDLEGKPLPVAMLVGTEPGAEIVYNYYLHQWVGPPTDPTVAPDPDDPTSPCNGKSDKDRAAYLALGRQIYFESTYLALDYATAWGPRKAWWNWSDFKSKYHIEAISLAGEGLVNWAMTGRGAAALVVGVGLAANAIEDGVATGLRAVDKKVLGESTVAALGTIYVHLGARWDAIDKLGTPEQRRAELEKLGAELLAIKAGHALSGVMRDLADYEYFWDRAGSDMTFHANIAARLYDLHLAERDLGCLPTSRAVQR